MVETISYRRSWALWMRFLKDATGGSFEDIGRANEVARANLSSFCHSLGNIKNVSDNNIRKVLLGSFGLLPDGLLMNGVHVWLPEGKLDEPAVEAVSGLIATNQPEYVYAYTLRSKTSHYLFFGRGLCSGVVISSGVPLPINGAINVESNPDLDVAIQSLQQQFNSLQRVKGTAFFCDENKANNLVKMALAYIKENVHEH